MRTAGLRCTALAGWLALALGASGCARPAQVEYERRLDATPPAARHAVYSDRIRELMDALDRLENERLPQAMDVSRERQRRIADVRRLALEMAASAAQITETAEESLEPGARPEFAAYADELAQRTRELADSARTLTPAEMSQRVASIRGVCNGCHARFRIPLEPPGT